MTDPILLVEDDPVHREMVAEALVDRGYEVVAAENGQQAADALATTEFTVALIDIRLPDVDGLVLLDLLQQRQPQCPVLLMTGQATVEAAVEAMRKGAHDYLAKPFRMELLFLKLSRLLHLRQVERENQKFRELFPASGMIGRSPALRRFLATAENVAGTGATVLILGESGTGKELAADFIHRHSPRRAQPLVKVNCGAIPESLLESELFGFEKGAFTGAERLRRGYLEQAHGGTLFLDEIGEISPAMQVKLLRVLQDHHIRRLGGETPIAADFRLIAATHRDLEELRATGALREDFFYRLNVIPLTLPPLRERREDIPLLVAHFVDRFASVHDRPPIRCSPEALDILQRYPFPGNVRELENLIERLQVLSVGDEVTPGRLPNEIRRMGEPGSEVIQCFRTDLPLREAIHDFESRFIKRVLDEEGGNRTEAARRLGISRKNLWEKLSG
ncbi:MAG: sigma-54-dependent Fis family transcriptional regulator [Desulfuromonadales bacterium]|nr:sigma-54-dependent Fis family transcriptional regulator [Desulfuromonadales bacterium]